MTLRERVPDEYYFRWMNEYLREWPRPMPGSQCSMCGVSIPPMAIKRHLERGVCGSGCNEKKVRKLKRKIESEKIPHFSNLIHHWPDIADEMQRGLRVFGEDGPSEFPYKLGRWVKDGDVVIRDGIETIYSRVSSGKNLHPEVLRYVLMFDPDLQRTLSVTDGTGTYQSFVTIDGCGRPTNTTYPGFAIRKPKFTPLFYKERILHVDEFDIPLIWNTPVFAIEPREKTRSYERKNFNSKIAAASRAKNSYMARVKKLGIPMPVAELVDVDDLKGRDLGFCPLCGVELSWEEAWPGDFYPTIDHIVPVTKGGPHVAENIQWVHWRCNLMKSDR